MKKLLVRGYIHSDSYKTILPGFKLVIVTICVFFIRAWSMHQFKSQEKVCDWIIAKCLMYIIASILLFNVISNEARYHLCNERYIRVELTPSPLLCNAIWGYMRPFEPGISPKCTILNDKFNNAHGSLCRGKNQLYQEMGIFIDNIPFWSMHGRFWSKNVVRSLEKNDSL